MPQDTLYLVGLEYNEPALDGPFATDEALLARAREIKNAPDTAEDFVCFRLTINEHGAPGVAAITDEELDDDVCPECGGDYAHEARPGLRRRCEDCGALEPTTED